MRLSSRHRTTLGWIFEEPTPSDLPFRSLETLVVALGGEVIERAGSRVAFILGGQMAHFHRPHPKPATRQAAVRQMRAFLRSLGVTPEGMRRGPDD